MHEIIRLSVQQTAGKLARNFMLEQRVTWADDFQSLALASTTFPQKCVYSVDVCGHTLSAGQQSDVERPIQQ